jgi:hypothetical protein
MTPRRYAKHDQSYQNGTPAHAPEVQSCRSRRSSGLQGDLSLTTRDGNVTLDHLSGDLRIKSGDGQVKITNADWCNRRPHPATAASASMASSTLLRCTPVTVRWRSAYVRAPSSLGASTIQSSDGSVTIRVPQNFAANLNVHTSDGHVDCALPLTMDHYQSGGDQGHQLRGKLNGGGTPLTIHTSDGNVKIEYL